VGRNGVSPVSKKKGIKAAYQTNERPHRLDTRLHLSSKPPYHQPTTPTSSLSTLDMLPPARNTRSRNNPGVVDLPKPRRSPADVATDKAESKRIAAANAKKVRERAARVARLENEIRTAQREAASPSGGSQKSRVKRTVSRQDSIVEDSEVSLFQSFLIADSPCPQGSKH
jgi:hypothetical protein